MYGVGVYAVGDGQGGALGGVICQVLAIEVADGESQGIMGYNVVKGKTSVFDVQATILNQLGFDHEKFTYPFQGRPFRLTDVSGRVIREIL